MVIKIFTCKNLREGDEINERFHYLFIFSHMLCVTFQFQQLKTNKNMEFHHSSKTDNPVYPIY